MKFLKLSFRLKLGAALVSLLFSLTFAVCCASAQGQEKEPQKYTDKGKTIDKGKMAFVKGTCWTCHSNGGNSLNGDKPLKGARFLKKYPDDAKLMEFIRKGSAQRGMPSFPKEKISDEQLKLIVGYIRSLKANSNANSSAPNTVAPKIE